MLDTEAKHVIMPAMFQAEMNITALSGMSSIRRALRLIFFCVAVLCTTRVVAVGQKIDADKLPMYGQPGIERPENLKKADEAFVREDRKSVV